MPLAKLNVSEPRQLVILQPDAIVTLGNWLPALEDLNITYRLFPLWKAHSASELPAVLDSLNPQKHALIILGGRQNALDVSKSPWLDPLNKFLRQAVPANLPILGVCLGAQILAAALDGQVIVNSPYAEEGLVNLQWTTSATGDPLFGRFNINKEIPVFASHDDAISVIPPGGVLLASSTTCPVQIFRVNDAWGLQFHPEANAKIVADWREAHGEDASDLYTACQTVEKTATDFGLTLLKHFLLVAQVSDSKYRNHLDDQESSSPNLTEKL